MGEKSVETFSTENRSNALALMRFFSVDVDSEMNIASTSNNFQVQEMALWSKEFVFKLIQLVTGFVCIAIYSEGVKIPQSSRNSMMFPNIVFSSFIIITSVIVLSYLLKCAMPEVQARIFHILGMILYFASAAVTVYEGMIIEADNKHPKLLNQKRFLLATSAISYFNSIMYGADVYYSIKKAVGKEIKIETL